MITYHFCITQKVDDARIYQDGFFELNFSISLSEIETIREYLKEQLRFPDLPYIIISFTRL